MFRYIIKVALYFAILFCFMAVGLFPSSAILTLLLTGAVLAAVNTLIRPIFVAIALPFNILFLGLASVFANLLTLVIANAIMGGVIARGFWPMLLAAFVIMLADDGVRVLRRFIKKTQEAKEA